MRWQTDCNECFIDGGYIACLQSRTIAPSAFSGSGGKTLVAEWVVNHTCLHVVSACNRDGNGKIRVTVNVIRRSIERVDDPGKLIGAGGGRLWALFLAYKAMLGESSHDDASDSLLRREICIRDEVADAFRASLKAALPGKQLLATGARGRFAGLKPIFD